MGLFFIKSAKRCVYVNMLFLILVLVENVFIGLKKGISKKMHWVAAKHTAVKVLNLNPPNVQQVTIREFL